MAPFQAFAQTVPPSGIRPARPRLRSPDSCAPTYRTRPEARSNFPAPCARRRESPVCINVFSRPISPTPCARRAAARHVPENPRRWRCASAAYPPHASRNLPSLTGPIPPSSSASPPRASFASIIRRRQASVAVGRRRVVGSIILPKLTSGSSTDPRQAKSAQAIPQPRQPHGPPVPAPRRLTGNATRKAALTVPRGRIDLRAQIVPRPTPFRRK